MKTMRLRQNVATSCRLAASRVLRQLRRRWMSMCFDQFASARRQAGGLSPRTGTTLTEVLMSLMIMSIGIVSVATLFPIATLRTLEASKQTGSAIASFSANAAIDARPELIHNPDDGISELNSLFSAEPVATKYTRRGDIVFGSAFRGTNYVVDPWGYWEMYEPPPTLPALPTQAVFGNVGGVAVTSGRIVRRWPAWFTAPPLVNPNFVNQTAARNAAVQFVAQPDNWKFVTEDIAIGSTTAAGGIHSVTLDAAADLSSVVISVSGTGTVVYGMYRAVIFDLDGAHSETRFVTRADPATNQVFWTEDVNLNGTLDPGEDSNGNGVLDHFPLPAGYNGNVGRVRIEVADQVYTWMLTVRKPPTPTGTCAVDAVVFFKRGFDPAFEEVHAADFRVNGYGPNDVPDSLPPTGDDMPGPNYRVRVVYTGDRPPVRRGGYVFDTSNAFWYRIRGIEEGTEDRNGNGTLDANEDRNGNGTIDTTLDLLVDEPIRADNGGTGGNSGGAILHPNVVNVFPLENKKP